MIVRLTRPVVILAALCGVVASAERPAAPARACSLVLEPGTHALSTEERLLLRAVPVRRSKILQFLERSFPDQGDVNRVGTIDRLFERLWGRAPGLARPSLEFGYSPRSDVINAAWLRFLDSVDRSPPPPDVSARATDDRVRAHLARVLKRWLDKIDAVPVDALAIINYFRRSGHDVHAGGYIGAQFDALWSAILGIERPWNVVMEFDAEIVLYKKSKRHAEARIVCEWQLFLAELNRHR